MNSLRNSKLVVIIEVARPGLERRSPNLDLLLFGSGQLFLNGIFFIYKARTCLS